MRPSLNLFIFVILFCLARLVPAAVPSSINYQGRLTNASGAPQPGVRAMGVKIYNEATNGTLLYSETVGDVTVDANGVYGFQFGAGASDAPASIANALTAPGEQWLELVIDGVPQAPRQKVLAVPFALLASKLPDGAVTAPMIADGAIGLAKICGLGSAAKANVEDFVSHPIGPFGSNQEAIEGGVADGGTYYKPDGTLWRAMPLPPHINTKFHPIRTVGLIGDSISDLATSYDSNGYNYCPRWLTGYGACLEFVSMGRVKSVGPTPKNQIKFWGSGRFDSDLGYSGITAHHYLIGRNDSVPWFPPLPWTPIQDAIAAAPDVYIVHIGTNDLDQPSATVITRVRNLWAALVATGIPVIGTDILTRGENSPETRDLIAEINTGLRAAWAADGLADYRQWDNLVEKDENGYGNTLSYANTGDQVHPSQRLCMRMAQDINSVLSPFYANPIPEIPPYGDNRWITPNPYVYGGTTLAMSWASSYLGTPGTDVIFSKVEDDDGLWQRVQTTATTPPWSTGNGVYARNSNAVAYVGKRVRATMRIRSASPGNLTGIGLLVQCVGADVGWTVPLYPTPHSNISPLPAFDGLFLSEPFIIPSGTSAIDISVAPCRAGIFDFQACGVFMAN